MGPAVPSVPAWWKCGGACGAIGASAMPREARDEVGAVRSAVGAARWGRRGDWAGLGGIQKRYYLGSKKI